MRQVAIFSLLLIAGMVGAQLLPGLLGAASAAIGHGIQVLTMVVLAFIIVHVGYEFELDKTNLHQYGWDYVVAMTAAAFPSLFVVLYFVFVLLPSEVWGTWEAWQERSWRAGLPPRRRRGALCDAHRGGLERDLAFPESPHPGHLR